MAKKIPEALYAKGYEEVEDLHSASYVAKNWGDFRVENENFSGASAIFSRIISSNPTYFLNDLDSSYKDFHKWSDLMLYGIAARVGDAILSYIKDDTFKEKLMIDVSLWYELDSNPKEVKWRILRLFKDSSNVALQAKR